LARDGDSGAEISDYAGSVGVEGSGSFLKKRTKKLLPVARALPNAVPDTTIKSFLLLFFKKEALPSTRQARQF
jgi:hypothetical protein